MQTYWAAEPDSRKTVDECIKRIRRYRQAMRDTGRALRMLRSWRTYYGYAPDGNGDANAMRPSGKQGELADMTGNDFAALVTQAVVLTTSSRPAFKSVATNSDYESTAQAVLSDGLQAHYERTKGLGSIDRSVCRRGLIMSEAWQIQTWDSTAGDLVAVDPESGEMRRTGDIAFSQCLPFDVAYDPDSTDIDAIPWIAFKRRVLKSDLWAQLERRGKSGEALRLQSDNEIDIDPDNKTFDLRSRGSGIDRDVGKDLVDVWELRHLPTEALPLGRLVRFVTADVVLYDSVQKDGDTIIDKGLPYDELHAYPFAPERVAGSVAAHTPFFDIVSQQEGLDLVSTIMVTAANAGGISNLWVPDLGGLSVDQLAGGLNVLVSPVKPEAIASVKMDPQALTFASACLDMMRRRIGMNSAALGEPDKGMPAQMAALLQAQAVQFHSDTQEAWTRYVERSRTGVLRMLKRYADAPRIATISGKTNGWALKEFSKRDLEKVDRVTVEMVNPVSQTMAGKRELLDWLGQRGLISDARAAISFLDTGRVEPVYEAESLNLARIRQDKETLMRGQPIQPLITDTHWLDIPEYLAVLATPEARTNPAVVQVVTQAVQQKLEMWKAMDPALLMLLKGPPPPLMPMPGAPPMPGEAPPAAQQGPGGPAPGLPEGAPPIRLPKPPEMKRPTDGAPISMPGSIA